MDGEDLTGERSRLRDSPLGRRHVGEVAEQQPHEVGAAEAPRQAERLLVGAARRVEVAGKTRALADQHARVGHRAPVTTLLGQRQALPVARDRLVVATALVGDEAEAVESPHLGVAVARRAAVCQRFGERLLGPGEVAGEVGGAPDLGQRDPLSPAIACGARRAEAPPERLPGLLQPAHLELDPPREHQAGRRIRHLRAPIRPRQRLARQRVLPMEERALGEQQEGRGRFPAAVRGGEPRDRVGARGGVASEPIAQRAPREQNRRRQTAGGRCGHRLAEQLFDLRPAASLPAVSRESTCQGRQLLRSARAHCPAPSRTEVVEGRADLVEGRLLPGPAQAGDELRRARRQALGVPVEGPFLPVAGAQPRPRAEAQHLVEREPPPGLAPEQGAVDEQRELAQVGAGHRRGVLHARRADEDRETGEGLPRALVELLPGAREEPVEDPLVAARGPVEQAEVEVETLGESRERQAAQPARGELDPDGRAPEPAADRRDRAQLRHPDHEPEPGAACRLEKELHRSGPGGIRRSVQAGEIEPADLHDPFPLETERAAAGGEQLHLGRRAHELGSERARLLEAALRSVDEQQEAPLADEVDQALAGLAGSHRVEPEPLAERRREPSGLASRRNRQVAQAVREEGRSRAVEQAGRDLEGEAALADPPGAHQCHQAGLGPLDEPRDLGELPRPADERGGRHRQVVWRRQRRGAPGHRVEEPGAQPLRQAPRRRRWLDLESLGQQPPAALVLRQRCGGLTGQREQLHHHPVRRLAPTVEGDEPTAPGEALADLAPAATEVDITREGAERELAEPLALGEQPLLERLGVAHREPGEELAAVEQEAGGDRRWVAREDGPREGCCGCLEAVHVDLEPRAAPQAHIPTASQEPRPAGFAIEVAPQVPERPAQVPRRPFLRQVGPEEAREAGAGERAAGEGEQGEDGRRLRRLRMDGSLGPLHREAAEQTDAELRVPGGEHRAAAAAAGTDRSSPLQRASNDAVETSRHATRAHRCAPFVRPPALARGRDLLALQPP